MAALTDTQAAAQAVADVIGGRRIAVMESCTAGRVASALGAVELASTFFTGALVAYTTPAKQSILGLDGSPYRLDAVEQMATAVRRLFDVDVAVATSGVAGTEPVDGEAPGTVFIATDVAGRVTSRLHRLPGDPPTILEQATVRALRDLLAALQAPAR